LEDLCPVGGRRALPAGHPLHEERLMGREHERTRRLREERDLLATLGGAWSPRKPRTSSKPLQRQDRVWCLRNCPIEPTETK
jgi:hypothetical protein